MLTILILGSTLGSLAVNGQMLGPADVTISNIVPCPEPEQYSYALHVTRRKLNRSMDVFEANLTNDIDLDENIGIHIDVAKWGDGGYKPHFQEFKDNYACAFIMKWMEQGFKKALRAIGHEENCPLRAGVWRVKDYILDYEELPNQMIYGDFRLDAYFKKGDENLACGPADLLLKNVEDCPDPDQYPYRVYLKRTKYNRTLDTFEGNTTFDVPWDEHVGVYANVAKWGDGGYKPNAYEFEDDYMCKVLMKYADDGFKRLLRMANHPEECPVKPGTYSIKNYVLNYDEMPPMLYGDFRIDIFILLDGNRVACFRIYVDSKPKLNQFPSFG